MSQSNVRETLRAVESAVDVPPMDEAAVRRLGRAQRRRRGVGRAAVGLGAAGVVAAGLAVGMNGSRDTEQATPADSPSADATPLLQAPAFVLQGQSLAWVRQDGSSQALGVRAESILGWTEDAVYAIDLDSRVTAFEVITDGDDTQIKQLASPVRDPVQWAEVSSDGRYLSWIDLKNRAHWYDLGDDKQLGRPVDVGAGGQLLAVAENGMLLTQGDRVVVHDGEGVVMRLPGVRASTVRAGDLSRNAAAVDDGTRTRLFYYGLASPQGEPYLAATLTGNGAMGIWGERLAAVDPSQGDRSMLEAWDGERLEVTGLEDVDVESLRWSGTSSDLLVNGGSRDGVTHLYRCSLEMRCERLPIEGDVSLGL